MKFAIFLMTVPWKLEKIEKDLFSIVNSIKFSNYKNDVLQKIDTYVQQKIDTDIAELN